MNQPQPMQVHRITLSTKRVVILRDMKIKDQNLAMQICGAKAKDNHAYLSTLIQQELLKMLIIEVEGKKLSAIEKEKLDDLFSYQEYIQLGQALGKMMGGDEMGEYQVELGTTGE